MYQGQVKVTIIGFKKLFILWDYHIFSIFNRIKLCCLTNILCWPKDWPKMYNVYESYFVQFFFQNMADENFLEKTTTNV